MVVVVASCAVGMTYVEPSPEGSMYPDSIHFGIKVLPVKLCFNAKVYNPKP